MSRLVWPTSLLSEAEFVEVGGIWVQRLPMIFEVWDSFENEGIEVWDQAVMRAPELFVVGVTWQSLEGVLEGFPKGFRLPKLEEWRVFRESQGLECLDSLWHWCEDAKSADEPYLRMICKGDESDWAGWQSHSDDLGFRLVFDPSLAE